MFFDSNCLNANKIINAKCNNLLTISNQTLYNILHSICNDFIVRIEFDNVLAQFLAIQFN